MSAQLFSAVTSGDTQRVRELLALDPTAARMKDAEGATPLHYATVNGEREIAELLLAKGANIKRATTSSVPLQQGGRLSTCASTAGCWPSRSTMSCSRFVVKPFGGCNGS